MDMLAKQTEIALAKIAIANAGLYIATSEDISRLADVAADSYQQYPLHIWFSGGTYNEKVTKTLIETTLKTMDENCIIYADSPDMNGFAVWCLGFTGAKPIPFLTHGGIKLLFRGGVPLLKRLSDYETFAMRIKDKYSSDSDWYLYNISVASREQGKGIAKKLLRPMLDFCDQNNKMAYLETNKDVNVAIYERFEFELKEKCNLPGSDCMHYAMMRTQKVFTKMR